ncbi:hypothetical protein JXO52_01030 [bacterium]|nr:hypothetical protein [bacterium]
MYDFCRNSSAYFFSGFSVVPAVLPDFGAAAFFGLFSDAAGAAFLAAGFLAAALFAAVLAGAFFLVSAAVFFPASFFFAVFSGLAVEAAASFFGFGLSTIFFFGATAIRFSAGIFAFSRFSRDLRFRLSWIRFLFCLLLLRPILDLLH